MKPGWVLAWLLPLFGAGCQLLEMHVVCQLEPDGSCSDADTSRIDLRPTDDSDLRPPVQLFQMLPRLAMLGGMRWLGLGSFSKTVDVAGDPVRGVLAWRDQPSPQIWRYLYDGTKLVKEDSGYLDAIRPTNAALGTLAVNGYQDLLLVDGQLRVYQVPQGLLKQVPYSAQVSGTITYLHASTTANNFLLAYGVPALNNQTQINLLWASVGDGQFGKLPFGVPQTVNFPLGSGGCATGGLQVCSASGLLDEDERPDLVIRYHDAKNGDGLAAVFSKGPRTSQLAAPADLITVRDLDGEDKPEIFTAGLDGKVAVLRTNNSSLTLLATAQLPFSGTLLNLGVRAGVTATQIVALTKDASAPVQLVDLRLRNGQLTLGPRTVAVDMDGKPLALGPPPYLLEIGQLDGQRGEDLIIASPGSATLAAFVD